MGVFTCTAVEVLIVDNEADSNVWVVHLVLKRVVGFFGGYRVCFLIFLTGIGWILPEKNPQSEAANNMQIDEDRVEKPAKQL